MKLKLNGNDIDVKAKTIEELLKELDINPQRVVVEVNLEIIKRDRFADYKIKEGDSIEIVNFVGGG
ncbi:MULTISPECIES: sulfur carrier protein ThiS [Thermodesulfovibrio]|jgi:sulfur carrier protein|uniref:Thiamine biosynthesis protein ThiS n=1 Tax=Thermodesulfovibrio yellowstonii (strain ATCC 51303 / DSM 11347 / YP87) TaxID=289376 RepID=B5YJ72_THEYD|nr:MULTISPECIES: sulfur carrier protein ThiS [Thermodesulfovibrio]ACI21477.1 thiamine biosynthesis protein ThiS [Thermodesulfovibrio yellowstonii DSM 11347]MBC7190199.1 sulfur carrier protein ThiS [Candidatus Aerophobetes bacterium]